ncbi:hypothetical protein HEK616_09800 [Streptomyces nigrescens]|uniref:Uncharacterized protein n=1 Tax=Streptomyces nigrescens TaxID=1920 RepID=A0ABN6QT46_STRNI|nr:hypothetical protein HEK616_09800 [Streptomyces nigrescens]
MPDPHAPDAPRAHAAQLSGAYWLDSPVRDQDECVWCAQLRNAHTLAATSQPAPPPEQAGKPPAVTQRM